jgi:hypothetical protein
MAQYGPIKAENQSFLTFFTGLPEFFVEKIMPPGMIGKPFC